MANINIDGASVELDALQTQLRAQGYDATITRKCITEWNIKSPGNAQARVRRYSVDPSCMHTVDISIFNNRRTDDISWGTGQHYTKAGLRHLIDELEKTHAEME